MNFIILLAFLLPLNALVIIGAYIAANHKDTQGRGLILFWVNEKIKRLVGSYWSKPFLGCYKCMPSIWGSGIYLLVYFNFSNFGSLWLIPFYVLALCGLTSIIYGYYESQLLEGDDNRGCKKATCNKSGVS